MSRPLDQVLGRAVEDFTPERPGHPPWHQPTLDRVELASTGNLVTVPLRKADRVRVYGLGRPSWEQDDLEPFDWTPAGWGVPSP